MDARDTIVALASGGLPSGVAVVRVSGPLAFQATEGLVGDLPPARELVLRPVRRPADGALLDTGLVAVFSGPNSFTGEDVTELHLHGSQAVVRAVVAALCAGDGVRLAMAGEFTRRAFENGKLDLVEVEGLGDLIAADTEAQRAQAVGRMGGEISHAIETWRDRIIELMAGIEAQLDFSDEGDVGEADPAVLRRSIDELSEGLSLALEGYDAGRIVREGYRVALAGPPNVGKSSVLNRLAKSDIAIVTEEAGTTRDVREVEVDIGGHLVILIDSAGLRETESKAEAEGVRRARAALDTSDLVLWLTAPDVAGGETPPVSDRLVRVANKADLGESGAGMHISAQSGFGFDGLVALIRERVDAATVRNRGLTISHMRDREALEACLTHLESARGSLAELELASEELRQAAMTLERLIGRVDVEHVLDRLFAGFCIGK